MERRGFIVGTAGGLIGATSAQKPRETDEAAALQQAVEKYYSVYFAVRDEARYRRLLTQDYLLLENGEILDVEGDIHAMPAPGSNYKRTDAFDFRSTKIYGNTAYVVYFLKSDIVDEKGPSHKEWLESTIMRRDSGSSPWRIALLHSTSIEKPAG